MSYEGRSPLKDVVRSVLLGAAMITPVALAACQNEVAPPATPDTVTVVTPPTMADAASAPITIATDAPDAADAAPPTEIVRPRWDPTSAASKNMPSRGFSGTARARA